MKQGDVSSAVLLLEYKGYLDGKGITDTDYAIKFFNKDKHLGRKKLFNFP